MRPYIFVPILIVFLVFSMRAVSTQDEAVQAQEPENDRPLVGIIGRGGMEQTNTGFATEYFVDSESGNDAAVGTSADTAWRSLDAVNGADLHLGDVVRFKRGGKWRGQLKPKSGNEDAPITYTAYGPGDEKPRLLGSVPLDKLTDWIHEGNNLWSTRPDVVRQGNEDTNFLRLAWSVHQEGGADISMKTAPQMHHAHYIPVKEYTLSCNSPGTRQRSTKISKRHCIGTLLITRTSNMSFSMISTSATEPLTDSAERTRNTAFIETWIFRGSAVQTNTGRGATDGGSASVMVLSFGPMPKIASLKTADFGKFMMRL